MREKEWKGVGEENPKHSTYEIYEFTWKKKQEWT
jgi:hypothetical protein